MSKFTHRLASAFALAAVVFTIGSARADYTSASYAGNENMIAQWDAIDNAVDASGNRCHVENPAAWRELIGNVTVRQTGALVYGEDGVKFDGAAYMQANIPAVLTALQNKAFTVQLCVNVDDYVQFCALLDIGTGSSCRELIIDQREQAGTKSCKGAFSGIQYAADDLNNACFVDYDTTNLFKKDILITVAVDDRGAHVYLDGGATPIHTTPAKNGFTPNSDLVSIGYYINNAIAKFTLHSARFYDRALTPTEIAYNAAIDDIRFKGADVDETFNDFGVRMRQDGEFECLLSVDGGTDGHVKVMANGETTDETTLAELWLTNGTPVTVEYIPNVAGDWRLITGAPADATYPSASTVKFAMGAGARTLTAIAYPYSDDYIVSVAPFTNSAPYGRVVYTFLNTEVGRQPFFLKQAMTFEEALVVAGGGAGGGYQGAGGGAGGGVVHVDGARAYAAGAAFSVEVGKGGTFVKYTATGAKGADSVLMADGLSVIAIGGGGGGGLNGASGGGGAMAAGTASFSVDGVVHGGTGGLGRWDNITGELHCYASGGGGGLNGNTGIGGVGGADSGGNGGIWGASNLPESKATPGVDGLGGGGGGRGNPDINDGFGHGGSGAVILAFSVGDTMARHFSFEPFEVYPVDANGEAKPAPAIFCGEDELTEGDDYTLAYEHNTTNDIGVAYMVIVGKGEYAGVVQRYPFVVKSPIYVTPTGTGDGTSWADAMDLATAVAKLNAGEIPAGTEIWCKAGTYDLSNGTLTLRFASTICGGFAADAENPVKAADGAKSVFDGKGEVDCLFVIANPNAATGAPIVFKDCGFTHGKKCAIQKNSNASLLKFENCDFVDCRTGNIAENFSASILSATANYYQNAKVSFADCSFRGNVARSSGIWGGIYASHVELSFDRCEFITNGVPFSYAANQNWDKGALQGALVYATGGYPITCKDCRFVGNRARPYSGGFSDAALFYVRSFGVLTLDHCAFVGNDLVQAAENYNQNGALVYLAIEETTHSATHVIRNCTFSDNLLGLNSAACVKVAGVSTSVLVENCIFSGTRKNETSNCPRDIYIANGSGTVRYSLFDSLEEGVCIGAASGKTFDHTEGVIAGDPNFVKRATSDLWTSVNGYLAYLPESLDAVMALDVHVKSAEGYRKNGDETWYKEAGAVSAAIDAGDPEADYSNETTPNGDRLNVGYYGNTEEASRTAECAPEILGTTAEFPNGLTQPRLSVTIGGTGAFAGNVQFFVSTNGGVSYVSSELVSGATNGATVVWSAPFFAEPDSSLSYYATLTVAGSQPQSVYPDPVTVTGVKPPWEKPGDVILVSPEGTATGSGQVWTDTIDLATAMEKIRLVPHELWLKAGNYCTSNGVITLQTASTFCGGFAGDASDMKKKAVDGAKSVFDGCGEVDCLFVIANPNAATGAPIVFKDCGFTHGKKCAIQKNSNASLLKFENCDFVDCRTGNIAEDFSASILSATANYYQNAKVSFADCSFRGNVARSSKIWGGIYASHVELSFDRCEFITNGVPFSYAANQNWDKGALQGALVYATGGYPITCKDCRFVGNRARPYIGGYSDAALFYVRSFGVLTLDHCAFVGNDLVQAAENYNQNGALVYLAIEETSHSATHVIRNCTFSDNLLGLNSAACVKVASVSTSVLVENCIFSGTRKNETSNCPRDIYIANGSGTVRYSLFDSLEEGVCIGAASGKTFDCTEGVIAGDPILVNRATSDMWTSVDGYLAYLPESLDAVMALDVHEKRTSPAVNTGNPESDWSQEPVPNGKRINMGVYGGTSEAACTKPGMAVRIR